MKARMLFSCQLLVSDLVGTTLADDGAVEKAMKAALETHGCVWQPEVFARERGRIKQEAMAAMLIAQGRAPQDAGKAHDDFVALLRAHYERSELPWIAGAEHAFRHLASRGISVVLATGFPAPIRDAIAPRVPWRDCLGAFLSGDDVTRGRPAPDLVLEAMRRCAIHDAGAVAVVGDTPADIASARAAGAGLVIAVTSGASRREQLDGADMYLTSVAELPTILGAPASRRH